MLGGTRGWGCGSVQMHNPEKRNSICISIRFGRGPDYIGKRSKKSSAASTEIDAGRGKIKNVILPTTKRTIDEAGRGGDIWGKRTLSQPGMRSPPRICQKKLTCAQGNSASSIHAAAQTYPGKRGGTGREKRIPNTKASPHRGDRQKKRLVPGGNYTRWPGGKGKKLPQNTVGKQNLGKVYGHEKKGKETKKGKKVNQPYQARKPGETKNGANLRGRYLMG